MKASELRDKNEEQLRETLLELRKEQFNLRMQQSTGQLARPSNVRQVRKDIARVKTIIREKNAGSQS